MPTRRTVLKGGVAALTTAGLSAGGFGRSARATGPDWSRLRERLSGSLVLPSDADYTVAKQKLGATWPGLLVCRASMPTGCS